MSMGHLICLEPALDSKVKRFIFASSAAVYGDTKPAKKKETLLLKPISPYGVSKMAAENYVRVFNELYALGTVLTIFQRLWTQAGFWFQLQLG